MWAPSFNQTILSLNLISIRTYLMIDTFTDKRTFSAKNHWGEEDVTNTLNCKLKHLSRIEIHFIHWRTLYELPKSFQIICEEILVRCAGHYTQKWTKMEVLVHVVPKHGFGDVEYFRVIIVVFKILNFYKFISETRSHNRLDEKHDENYQDSL